MICVFDKSATDFSSNGLGALSPTECTVTETLNGLWELTMKHPLDVYGKHKRLVRGNIIKAPVPASMTPALTHTPVKQETKEIWKVATSTGQRLRLRKGAGTNYKALGAYKNGTKVVLIAKTSSAWYEVTTPDGKHGYMSAPSLTYVRTETTSSPAAAEVVESRQLRDQPFRIYRVVPSLKGVTVYARHIFYDLADNLILKYKPKDAAGGDVARQILARCKSDSGFTMYSDLTDTGSAEWLNVNPVEAMLGDAGLMETWHAELARDWYDVYAVKRVGVDRGVTVRQGKNIRGLSCDEDESNVFTRIVPIGTNADGDPLYLPEEYIDSPYIDDYATVKWNTLQVAEAKEVTKGDDKQTKEQCYKKMRKAAQAELDAGCDMPDFTVDVDFIALENTVEGAPYAQLNNIYLGDGVRVISERLGVGLLVRMTDYTYDCIAKRYTKMSLGTVVGTLESVSISAKQLASGSIPGNKIVPGGVTGVQLGALSVDSAKIGLAAIDTAHIRDAAIGNAQIANAAIGYAKIDEAAIGQLKADSIDAVTARIGELIAGSVTTDALYAALATIAIAQITTANIGTANIDWANIGTLCAEIAAIATAQITTANIQNANINWAAITNLSADIATIAKAQITTANIQDAAIDWASINTLTANVAAIALAQITTAHLHEADIDWASITQLQADIATIANARIKDADIDWAQIKDLMAGTAIIEKGVNGKLYVADLAVTEANMASLTVGELIIKGTDGSFYTFSVDENGAVTTQKKEVTGDNIANGSVPGGKLIENTITARELNVASIFADTALIRAIKAKNIDVDELFASEAVITKLQTMDISSNTSLTLRVGEIYRDMDALLGYRLEIISTSDVLSADIQSTTLTARVWHGSENVTGSISPGRFHWTRVSADTVADELWNASHTGVTYITLSVQDVQYSATYSCELMDE